MKITIKQLRDGNPWEVAAKLGIRYTGDMSAIPHGGTFYETNNWNENGYANCVRIQESEGTLWVETGTINKPKDLTDSLKCSGFELCADVPGTVRQPGEHEIALTAEVAIECCLAYAGCEVDSTDTFTSDNGKDYGDFPEFKIWQAAKPLIIALAADNPVPVKLPPIGELRRLFIELKKDIGDDYRADDDSETPSMSVTIGWSDKTGDWTYQTGDNSYTGGAYHYPHWAVITLDRRSNSTAVASDVLSQLSDLIPA